MIRLAATLALLCLFITGDARQKTKNNEEVKGFIVPREINLPLVVSQPGCPLIIRDIEIHGYLTGGSAPFFKAVNQGTKTIKGYEIVYLTGDGNGGGNWSATNQAIHPGESIFFDREIPFTRIASSSESKEVLKDLGIGKEMKGVLIFMVVRVEYFDGALYEDEKVYKYLKTYLSKFPR